MNHYRYSKQREHILSYIKSVKTHPTANVIYDELRPKFPNLSMGTVYRNLQILSDQGEITKLDFGSTFDHYDGYTNEHSHFVCTSCQQVYDMPGNYPLIDQVQKVTAHQIEGCLIKMKKGSFYYCEICKNLVKVIDANADALVCCGQPMNLLVPHTQDSGKEKHVPVIIKEGEQTRVVLGEVPHPMTKEHYIDFIQVETNAGKIGIQYVGNQEKAEAVFNLKAEEIVDVVAYCNLHGLWIVKN